ncbi:hypothetical protein DPEC_G00170550 [Dallia pectoralis]|uniref:Uncharacterized protein n=1 Tax=Dallia pectoralis TaxID=75939 RepID=A0ACC2GDL3_DALPE|nr:hypothetical protein DPEC_G00170550 [Dallia pectoralis]
MDDQEPPSVVDGPSLVWQPEKTRCRKSGCSNIFAGVNLRQLKRLFNMAGDRDAEQRAKLVLAGERRDGEEEKAREEEAVEARLVQTLVSFKVKARSRSGIRTEGHREPKWLKAFGHLRIKESLNEPEDREQGDPSDFKELDPLPGGSIEAVAQVEPQRPLEKLPLGRQGATTRQEASKGAERYLHRILH